MKRLLLSLCAVTSLAVLAGCASDKPVTTTTTTTEQTSYHAVDK